MLSEDNEIILEELHTLYGNFCENLDDESIEIQKVLSTIIVYFIYNRGSDEIVNKIISDMEYTRKQEITEGQEKGFQYVESIIKKIKQK